MMTQGSLGQLAYADIFESVDPCIHDMRWCLSKVRVLGVPVCAQGFGCYRV